MASKMIQRFKEISVKVEDENGQMVEIFKTTAHMLTVAERMKLAELIEEQRGEAQALSEAIENGTANKAGMIASGIEPIIAMVQIMTTAKREELLNLIPEDLVNLFQEANAFSLGTAGKGNSGEGPKA